MKVVESLHKMKRKVIKHYEKYYTINGLYTSKLPDKIYIKKLFKERTGKDLDLKNPKTLNEKLNWLKLYYRKPEYTMMVDKYAAKEFVDSRVGKGHTIPTLGVWDSFDEIDFDSLPDEFVLKCTHDCGSIKIIEDKNKIDKQKLREHFTWCLSQNYYKRCREWPYKNVVPRIIAEPIIEELGKPDSIEYKTTCFDGKVGFVTICQGIAHAEFEKRSNDHFDTSFNKLDFYVNYKPAAITPKKPENWTDIIEFAEKLSKGVPYLRVDTYVINGNILFGEMTFYTWGALMNFVPEKWDRILGDMLNLPDKKYHG